MVPALAVVVTPFVALAAALTLVGHGLPGAARSASGGVLANLAAPPRRRLAAGLLVLASVRAMVGIFVAFFLTNPNTVSQRGASPGCFTFWFAFGTLKAAPLGRSKTPEPGIADG